jgi:preprotein translocase subunit Sss1
MTKKIYQIQVALKDFSPRIWRRILVPSDLLLSDFHLIIQTAMGWEDSHLHQFIKNETFYTVRMKDDDFWDDMNNVDYKKMKISDLLIKEKDKIDYEYDFGDGWMHDITLEKILAPDDKIKYPVCLAGKMNCPPEDCGGVWGYSAILKILKKPDHEEYENYIEWLGEKFDPEYFNIDKVNKLLRKKGYGFTEL